MAHTGSYAMTTRSHTSDCGTCLTIGSSCARSEGRCLPDRRCSRVSPMVRLTLRPAASAAAAFCAMSSEDSPIELRRSECPSSTLPSEHQTALGAVGRRHQASIGQRSATWDDDTKRASDSARRRGATAHVEQPSV
eukprot:3294158-Prymnesium_polylepis.3